MKYKYLSIHNYKQNIEVNKAKKLILPSIRGTYLPSIDIQVAGGVAVNWFSKRVRIYLRNNTQ